MVVVVVDGHADVVQHRRRPQQLALDRVAGVQAGRGELVEQLERERRDVRRCARSRRRTARRGCSTGRARTSSNSGGSPSSSALEEDALAQAGLGRLERRRSRRPPSPSAIDERAGEDQVAARGLDARDARRARRPAARRAARSARRARRARCTKPWTPNDGSAGGALRGGGEVADRAADRRPAARRRRASHGARSSSSATCSRSALSCLRLAGSPPGRKRSVMRTAPSGHERASVAQRGRRRATSCIEPPPRSSTTPSASVVELTAAR